VIVTLGYLNEKNMFVADPSKANSKDNIHIRGVLIDKVMSSEAETAALTSGYEESSFEAALLLSKPSITVSPLGLKGA